MRIGIYSSVASSFLAELLSTYGRLHRRVDIAMVDGDPADHVAAIGALDRDVAFITGTSDWPDCERAPL